MGVCIQSCRSFFTTERTHAVDYASYLLFDLKGQSKVLSAVRSSLAIAEYATRENAAKHEQIAYANTMLGDIKTLINFARTPQAIESLNQRCRKTGRTFRKIYHKVRHKEPVGRRRWVKGATRASGVVKKTLSIGSDGFFKPVQMIGRRVDLGDTGEAIGKAGHIFSIVKSGFKIFHGTGKIYLGCNCPERRVVELILEGGKLTCSSLKLSGVKLHPVVLIVLSVCESIFGLAEAWVKTA